MRIDRRDVHGHVAGQILVAGAQFHQHRDALVAVYVGADDAVHRRGQGRPAHGDILADFLHQRLARALQRAGHQRRDVGFARAEHGVEHLVDKGEKILAARDKIRLAVDLH